MVVSEGSGANVTEAFSPDAYAWTQVLTSANWGGTVGNFFTGGLNLQVEHHLFPAVSFMHCAPATSLCLSTLTRNLALVPTLNPTIACGQ